MTIIPEKHVPLMARTDADFEQVVEIFDDEAMTQPKNLTGWTFRFVAKKLKTDASAWLEATGGAITLDALNGRVTAFIERETLAAAMPADIDQQDGHWALQATGPGDLDGVWAAGKFTLLRGL